MKRMKSLINTLKKSCSSLICRRNKHKRSISKEKKARVSSKIIEPIYSEIQEQPLNSRFVLSSVGSEASTRKPNNERVPMFLADVVEFLLLAILNTDQFYYFTCKWIEIEKKEKISKSYVLVLEGITLCYYLNNLDKFANLSSAFNKSCSEVLNEYSHAVINTMTILPLIHMQKDTMMKKYKCMDICLYQLTDINNTLRAVFPIIEDKRERKYVSTVQFNRYTLLLTPSNMLYEKYPLPIPGKLSRLYSDYVLTKDVYQPVHEQSPMFGLDCERCNTEGGSELYRVSIVDEFNNVVYNSYVLPEFEIVGTRDRFSEINREQLLEVKTTRADVQTEIRNLLPPDAILIGHSLNYDLHALKMMHPYVINTSCIYNMMGSRHRKSKLSELAWDYLDRKIQDPSKGHCSVEDANAAMDLVKLKLENSAQFGDIILQRHIEHHKRERAAKNTKSIYNKPAIVGSTEVLNEYLHCIKALCSDDCMCSNDVDRIESNDLGDIAMKSVKLIKERKFILTHLKMNEEDEESMIEVDRLINAIWNASTRETLLTVLLTGNTTCNGAIFYNIKIE